MIRVIRYVEGYGCNLELVQKKDGHYELKTLGMVNFRPEHIIHARVSTLDLEALETASSVVDDFDNVRVQDVKYRQYVGDPINIDFEGKNRVRVFYQVIPIAPLRTYLFC
jgi:hypothetical protein